MVSMDTKFPKWANACPSCGKRKGKDNRFCQECSPLKQDAFHYCWKGENASPTSKRKRAQRRYPMGPCEQCGKPGRDRHHINGDINNNRPDNIAILCRRCHMQADGRMDLGGGLAMLEHVRERERSARYCHNGHEFTEENTYRRPDRPQTRGCRRCRADAEARRRARLTTAA